MLRVLFWARLHIRFQYSFCVIKEFFKKLNTIRTKHILCDPIIIPNFRGRQKLKLRDPDQILNLKNTTDKKKVLNHGNELESI
jgi:hypothetical protein